MKKYIPLLFLFFAHNICAEHSKIFDVEMDCSTLTRSNTFISNNTITITTGNCWSQDCKAITLKNDRLCTSQDCRALVHRNSSECESDLCRALLAQNSNLCGNNRNCTAMLTSSSGMCQMKAVGCCKKCWCKQALNPDGTINGKKACLLGTAYACGLGVVVVAGISALSATGVI